jgi:hypothetical protein
MFAADRRFVLRTITPRDRARAGDFFDFATVFSVRIRRHQRRQDWMHASFAQRSERILSNLVANISAIEPSDDANVVSPEVADWARWARPPPSAGRYIVA